MKRERKIGYKERTLEVIEMCGYKPFLRKGKRPIIVDILPLHLHFPKVSLTEKETATSNFKFKSWKEAHTFFSGVRWMKSRGISCDEQLICDMPLRLSEEEIKEIFAPAGIEIEKREAD